MRRTSLTLNNSDQLELLLVIMSAMDWVRQRQCLNSDEKCDDIIEAAEMDDVDQHDVNNVTENSSGDAYPLLFFYDCENWFQCL